tara:strand:+ start:25443 stop:26312 length:870 start_codon:yes stop_codon:yes gene_type:complete
LIVTLADDTPAWRTMDAQTRANAYSPSTALPDGDLTPFIEAYIERSAAAYQALPNIKTLRYGPGPSHSVDIALPENARPVPVHVFLHGGYWQDLSKRESFFAAPQMVARGCAFAAVDYSLAPDASLPEIVAECRAAVLALRNHAAELGIDPARMVVSGSSAGAHLAAMLCLSLRADLQPAGVVLLSGIYDLEPLLGTYINDAVGLDRSVARENSPVHLDVTGFPPAILGFGAQETEEFKRQSRAFARHLRQAGVAVDLFETPGRNHFDIVFDLAGDGPLGIKAAAQAGL